MDSAQDFFTEQSQTRKLNKREMEFLAQRKAQLQSKVTQVGPESGAITHVVKGGDLIDRQTFSKTEIDTTEVDLTLQINQESFKANFAAMRQARKARLRKLALAHAKEDAGEYEKVYMQEVGKVTGEATGELAGESA